VRKFCSMQAHLEDVTHLACLMLWKDISSVNGIHDKPRPILVLCRPTIGLVQLRVYMRTPSKCGQFQAQHADATS